MSPAPDASRPLWFTRGGSAFYQLVLGRQEQLCDAPQHKIFNLNTYNNIAAVSGCVGPLCVSVLAGRKKGCTYEKFIRPYTPNFVRFHYSDF